MCEFRFLDRMISIKACYNTNITDTSCIVIEEHSVMSDICFLSTYPLLISNLHSDYIKKNISILLTLFHTLLLFNAPVDIN